MPAAKARERRHAFGTTVSYTAMSDGSGEGDDAVLTDFLEASSPTGNAESPAPSTTICCSFLVMRE